MNEAISRNEQKFLASFYRLVHRVHADARQTLIDAGVKPSGDLTSDSLRAEVIRDLAKFGLTTTGSLREDYALIAEAERTMKTTDEREEEKRAQAEFAKAVEEAQYFKSPEFREEVIEEIMAEGATRLQAEGRTRDQARLFAEAQRLNLM